MFCFSAWRLCFHCPQESLMLYGVMLKDEFINTRMATYSCAAYVLLWNLNFTSCQSAIIKACPLLLHVTFVINTQFVSSDICDTYLGVRLSHCLVCNNHLLWFVFVPGSTQRPLRCRLHWLIPRSLKSLWTMIVSCTFQALRTWLLDSPQSLHCHLQLAFQPPGHSQKYLVLSPSPGNPKRMLGHQNQLHICLSSRRHRSWLSFRSASMTYLRSPFSWTSWTLAWLSGDLNVLLAVCM